MPRHRWSHGRKKPGRVRRAKPGASPGLLEPLADAPPSNVHAIAYGPSGFVEESSPSSDQIRKMLADWDVVWINVSGLGTIDVIREMGALFGLHRLALEDVVNLGQRPKVEPYEEDIFIVCQLAGWEDRLTTEQISFFLGSKFVLSFQEGESAAFNPVIERIRHGKGFIRKSGSGYLQYALLDATVDSYFPVLERIGDVLDQIEEEIVKESDKRIVERTYQIKNDLIQLRRKLWPHREALSSLMRHEAGPLNQDTIIHLRDCYDHVIQAVDLTDSYREIASGLRDTFLSLMSNRMNEVMKVLTIIATIFIPLSFIAGLYGMNFNSQASGWNMPELDWYYGYPFSLGIMAVVAAGLVAYFWRKGWLG